MIRKLHHNAYRCRDSEETRRFYEDFLGLPLVQSLDLSETKTGRPTHTLHTFYRLDDGSHMAFCETDDMPFEFKKQHDFDLHIALEVAPEVLPAMLAKGRAQGIETRGPSDHGMIDSIYFRDPNGYVIELCAKRPGHDAMMDPGTNEARARLERWTRGKTRGNQSAGSAGRESSPRPRKHAGPVRQAQASPQGLSRVRAHPRPRKHGPVPM
jgi:catechol 2,3-dioxygenase-like lactoylglutathione lyase family enzyme